MKPSSAPAGRGRSRAQRPVRQQGARSLRGAPLRALPLLPRVGGGTVEGIYFTGDSAEGDRRRRQWSAVGPREVQPRRETVPADMKPVDFKPDPTERVERFMTAAQRAMADGEYVLAAQRLVYARRGTAQCGGAAADDAGVFAAGNLGRPLASARDWAPVDRERPAPHRFAARIYEDMGACDLAEEAAQRAVERAPTDAGAWERLGRLRLGLLDRQGLPAGV